MKTKIFFSLFLSVLSFGIWAQELGGNGGGGIFCPGKPAEIYDIVEGRIRHSLNIPYYDHQDTIHLGLKIIGKESPVLARLLENEISNIRDKMELLPIKIQRTLDSDNILIPENCDYKQIVNWDSGTGRIFVSQVLWNELSEGQKGILLFHEAAYALYRSSKYGLREGMSYKFNDLVRKFIAELFSGVYPETEIVKSKFLRPGIFIEFSGKSASPEELLRRKATILVPKDCDLENAKIIIGRMSQARVLKFRERMVMDLGPADDGTKLTFDAPTCGLKVSTEIPKFEDYLGLEIRLERY